MATIEAPLTYDYGRYTVCKEDRSGIGLRAQIGFGACNPARQTARDWKPITRIGNRLLQVA
jgi:hypothetical protein